MADTKDPALIEYENMIEQLIEENESLKNQVSELKEEIYLLKHTDYSFKEPSPSIVEKETNKPAKWSRKGKKKDKIEPLELIQEEILESPESIQKELELEFSSDLESPVPTISSLNKPIIEGYSRRQCPQCDNNRHKFIYEEIDKTNIIMAYPRIYGKKYKCGVCGTNWKVPTTE